MVQSPPYRLRSVRVVVRSAILALCLLAVVLPATSHAQLTGETLLSNIVEQYGPQYSDVDVAIERMRAGRVTEARDALITARQKNSDLPPANVMMAQILFGLQQVNAGRIALQEAIKEDPTDPSAFVYLAEVALQTRQWAQAALLYDKALGLAESYTANDKHKKRLLMNIQGGKARLAEFEEDWGRARDLLQELIKLEPENTLALTRYGRVLFKMATSTKEEEEAYKIFQRLHKIDEKNTAYADVNMGLLYEQAGKRNNAKVMMERAAKNDADNVKTRLAVAKWALDTGNMDMAKQNAEAALSLDGTSLDAKLYVGLVARFNRDLGTAEQMFKEAHLQAPTHLGAITQLSLVLIDQSDETKRAQALEFARLNSRLFNDLSQASGREAAVTLGWVLARHGQTSNAVRSIQQALNAGAVSADSAYHAAQILYDSGLSDAAQRVLTPALQNNAVFPNRSAAEQLLRKIGNS